MKEDEGKLKLSDLEEIKIDPDGRAVVDGRILQFLPFYHSERRLYKLDDETLIVVGLADEIWWYIRGHKNFKEGEVVHVFATGLAQPPAPDEDTLRFSTNLPDKTTTEELKMALRNDDLVGPYFDRIFSKTNDKDWRRMTTMANKFGLARLVRYFRKFVFISVYTEDLEFMKKAISFLFLFPDPSISFAYIDETMPDDMMPK